MSNEIVNGVSTFLWDTTYTTSFEAVNRKISENATYPKTFSNTIKAHKLFDYISKGNKQSYFNVVLKPTISNSTTVVFSGEWNNWQLHLRGNGNTIYLKLSITKGEIKLVEGEKIISESKDGLDGGYLIVEVKLDFVNQADNKKALTLCDNPNSQVSIVDHSFPNIDKSSLFELVVEGAFKQYLNTQQVLNQFRYIFSTVNINDKATGDFAWLKPSDTGYAVFVPDFSPTPSKSLFSILCMTDNTKAPPFAQQSVDGSVFTGITTNANAVLCISPQKFCKHFLIEAAKNLIKGTVDSDYDYSTDGTEVHNTKQIIFKNVEVADKKTVDLTIKALDFSIRIVNDHIDLQITNASYHETMYDAYITLNQRMEFTTKKVGVNTIFILKEGEEFKGTIHTSIEPTETAEILKWVGVGIEILAGLLFIGGAAIKIGAKIVTTATRATVTVTDAVVSGAEVAEATAVAADAIAAGSNVTKALMISNRLFTVGSLCGVLGLPFSLCSTISVAIAKGDFSKVPTLEKFAENFLSQIEWAGVEKTTLLGARLNDAFLLDFKIE